MMQNMLESGKKLYKMPGQETFRVQTVNHSPDGTCRTIKSQYYKTSAANFERNSTFGATGVLERSEKMSKVGQISSEGSQCGSVYSDTGNMPTLTAGSHGDSNAHIYTKFRIRKLTPRECWRLMGFSDDDFEKAESVNSNTQLYKQAGNSIVTNVLAAIFGQMIPGKENTYKELAGRNPKERYFFNGSVQQDE